jgi:hypothetical protein
MPRTVEVDHRIWIAAPVAAVQSQFADVQHHIDANVHPKLRFELLAQEPGRARFKQAVKLLGLWQEDVMDRRIEPDGTIRDVSIEGANKGGTLEFRFKPEEQAGRPGTCVDIRIALPTPPFLGFLAPFMKKQIVRDVTEAAEQDKKDLESGNYRMRH